MDSRRGKKKKKQCNEKVFLVKVAQCVHHGESNCSSHLGWYIIPARLPCFAPHVHTACQIESVPRLLRRNYQEDMPGASVLKNSVCMEQICIKTPDTYLAEYSLNCDLPFVEHYFVIGLQSICKFFLFCFCFTECPSSLRDVNLLDPHNALCCCQIETYG